jgi:hypothetical protein
MVWLVGCMTAPLVLCEFFFANLGLGMCQIIIKWLVFWLPYFQLVLSSVTWIVFFCIVKCRLQDIFSCCTNQFSSHLLVILLLLVFHFEIYLYAYLTVFCHSRKYWGIARIMILDQLLHISWTVLLVKVRVHPQRVVLATLSQKLRRYVILSVSLMTLVSAVNCIPDSWIWQICSVFLACIVTVKLFDISFGILFSGSWK